MTFILRILLDFIALVTPKINYPYIVILNYHSINNNSSRADSEWSISVDMFEEQIKYLKDKNAEIIAINDIEKYFLRNPYNNKLCVCITFDDGLEDNYINAIPVLKKYGIYNSTFFIVANSIINNVENAWWLKDRKNLKLMNIQQIKNLHKSGYEIGSHALSHKNLNNAQDDEIYEELIVSKKILDTSYELNCTSIAVPFSISGNTKKELLFKNICSKNDYKSLFLGRFGYVKKTDYNKEDLPRIPIYKSDSMKTFSLKLNGKFSFVSKIYYFRKKLRYIFGL